MMIIRSYSIELDVKQILPQTLVGIYHASKFVFRSVQVDFIKIKVRKEMKLILYFISRMLTPPEVNQLKGT